MRKWILGLIAVAFCCIPIFLHRSASPGLLADTDTQFLLTTIRQKNAPLSWFTGDWPLGNHFYRPVSTLAFEMDNRLYGQNAAGYGLTNCLLCIASVLLLFWLLKELTERIEIALPGAMLFAFWHVDQGPFFAQIAVWLAPLTLLLLFLPGRNWRRVLLAALVIWYLRYELTGIEQLEGRMLDWLPGRTASVMTVFALIAMAAYARFERRSAERLPVPEPGPLDPPATKSTQILGSPSKSAWIWAVVAVAATALAFGSYEQAVMLPALLFGVALCLRLQRLRVRWGWQAAFWSLLLGYLAVRHAIVPSTVSSYQAQQFRSGPGVWQSLLDYFLPAARDVWLAALTFDIPLLMESGGMVGLIFAFPWWSLIFVTSNVAAVIASRPVWLLPLTGWAMSCVAFLPMAWLKHFDHYDYLPMAMRALLVSALIGVAGKALVSAASRPALQAPPRLDPAPGSLPHP
jgi:hypothetical protein